MESNANWPGNDAVKFDHAMTNTPMPLVARLHNNGCEVRVDLGNTGKNWPDCGDQYQPGFPWLSFARDTWAAAEKWAREHGATEIIRSGE